MLIIDVLFQKTNKYSILYFVLFFVITEGYTQIHQIDSSFVKEVVLLYESDSSSLSFGFTSDGCHGYIRSNVLIEYDSVVSFETYKKGVYDFVHEHEQNLIKHLDSIQIPYNLYLKHEKLLDTLNTANYYIYNNNLKHDNISYCHSDGLLRYKILSVKIRCIYSIHRDEFTEPGPYGFLMVPNFFRKPKEVFFLKVKSYPIKILEILKIKGVNKNIFMNYTNGL